MGKNAKITMIDDQKKLGEFIDGIKKRGAVLDRDIHVAALSAAAVFGQHGNVFYINHLYASLGKGARHVAMTAWLLAYAGVQANEGENKDTTPFVKDANKQVDLVGGTDMPWYDMKASAKPDEVLDVLKLTLAIIKRAKNPKDGQQLAHAEMISGLEALAEQFAPVEEVATETDPA